MTTIQYLKPIEIRNIFRISRDTLKKWREKGCPFIGANRTLRYTEDEVRNWLKEQATK